MDHKANRHRPIEVYLYDQMVIVFLEGDQAADCHNVRHYMTFALQVSPVRTPRTKTKSPREVVSSFLLARARSAGAAERPSHIDSSLRRRFTVPWPSPGPQQERPSAGRSPGSRVTA